MPCSSFSTGFSSMYAAPKASAWYQDYVPFVDAGTKAVRYFYFTNPVAQQVTVSVDFYSQRMFAKGCVTGQNLIYLMVYNSAGAKIASYNYYTGAGFNSYTFPVPLAAGSYKVYTSITWATGYTKRDATFRVLSPGGVSITTDVGTRIQLSTRQ